MKVIDFKSARWKHEDEPSCSKHVEDIKKLKIKLCMYELCISSVYIVQSK